MYSWSEYDESGIVCALQLACYAGWYVPNKRIGMEYHECSVIIEHHICKRLASDTGPYHLCWRERWVGIGRSEHKPGDSAEIIVVSAIVTVRLLEGVMAQDTSCVGAGRLVQSGPLSASEPIHP